MELKLSKSLVKKLLELANGATIPAAQFKGPLCEALLKDGCICSKSNKSVIRYYVTDKAAFRSVLGDYNDGLKDLEGTLTILQKENASRSEQVQIAGNSKIRQVRSCKGFLVNSYEPINCSLNESPFIIAPPDGSYVFIADYDTFKIPQNAVVRLQDRASFFIPSDVEMRIQNGSAERYDNQLERYEKMEIIDSRTAPVVKLIKHYHKGYDQEGFIE